MPQIISIESLQISIAYLYLLSFCPPGYIWHLRQHAEPLRLGLAKQAELSEAAYFARVIPEACQRIVAFHQQTKEPDISLVTELTWAARAATDSPEAAQAFSAQMNQVTGLLVTNKTKLAVCNKPGFQVNPEARRYIFFGLVSKPDYGYLHQLLTTELNKPVDQQDVSDVTWAFAVSHLWRTLGVRQTYVSADHLGNLAYCLTMLGTHKSRIVLPEDRLRLLHQANQVLIEKWRANGNQQL